jgi:oligopeptide/dipeptide ABC transporter ATP-binding protein
MAAEQEKMTYQAGPEGQDVPTGQVVPRQDAGAAAAGASPIVHIRGLHVRNSRNVIIHNLDLDVYQHDLLGVAGESGGGKTILIRTILNILPAGIEWEAREMDIFGQDVRHLSAAQRRQINGEHIGFIPQNTVNYLHPMMKIKSQITESYVMHGHGTRQEGLERAAQLLSQAGLPDPERVLNSYAWELSGGMRQRVNIAMALMNKPELLIADEPTTALDAVVQRQILELFRQMHEKTGVSILMISHDLGMLRLYSERCMVMYAGRMVEIGPTEALFSKPLHPYTNALLRVIPSLKPVGDERLSEIPGYVPDSGRDTDSCIFMPRCSYAQDLCSGSQSLKDLGGGHMCLCRRAGAISDADTAERNDA